MEPEGTNKVLRPFTCPAIKATNVFIYWFKIITCFDL
jgi:hypothetical protein